MNRFIINVTDDVSDQEIREVLYENSVTVIDEVIPVRETWEFANGKPRMTTAQRDKLWALCGGYNVPFREDDYHPSQFSSSSPIMYEGWIGGQPGTIYVGVEPNGRSHS